MDFGIASVAAITVICYLVGLVEQGCDGPVHDALDKLDKHLNKAAHKWEDAA